MRFYKGGEGKIKKWCLHHVHKEMFHEMTVTDTLTMKSGEAGIKCGLDRLSEPRQPEQLLRKKSIGLVDSLCS